MTTSHAARKIPSAPTSHTNKVKNLTVEIPPLYPSAMKTGRSVPSASPRASKEAVKIDVGSRVLKRDEDVAHAPSASHRQSGSPSLIMSTGKITGSTPQETSRPKLSPLESPRPTLSKSLPDRDIDVTNISGPSPAASPQQVTSDHLILLLKHFVQAYVNSWLSINYLLCRPIKAGTLPQ
jgi:hypothetical protein